MARTLAPSLLNFVASGYWAKCAPSDPQQHGQWWQPQHLSKGIILPGTPFVIPSWGLWLGMWSVSPLTSFESKDMIWQTTTIWNIVSVSADSQKKKSFWNEEKYQALYAYTDRINMMNQTVLETYPGAFHCSLTMSLGHKFYSNVIDT